MAEKRASKAIVGGADCLAVSKLTVRSSALAEAKANLSAMSIYAFDNAILLKATPLARKPT